MGTRAMASETGAPEEAAVARSAGARVLAGGVIALALAACVSPYTSAVDSVRQALIGVPATHLRTCLPVPEETDVQDGVEVYTYRWKRVFPRRSFPSDRPSSLYDLAYDPTDEREKKRNVCELTVEIQDGRVRDVRSRGFDGEGLRADGACMLEARRCIPVQR